MNVCPGADEVLTMVNRVERRLLRLRGGKWVGAVQRMRICTTSEG
jgi:hypothetical protein